MRKNLKTTPRRTAATAVIAASALLPWASGCDLYNTAASFYGVGYLTELWLTAGRSLLGTTVLHIINTF